MTSLGRNRGAGQPGRPRAYYGNPARLFGGQVVELGLVTRPGINQARSQFAAEYVVQTGLIAANAGIDLIGSAFGGLTHQLCIGQERPGHRHHIRIAGGKDFLGDCGHVDAVGGNERNAQGLLHLGRDLDKSAAGHRCGDGRHP